jgi:hypothetical protein
MPISTGSIYTLPGRIGGTGNRKEQPMPEIQDQMQTPGIDQVQKDSRKIFYKEHEFRPEYTLIIAELDALINDGEGSASVLKAKRDEIVALIQDHGSQKDDVLMVVNDKIDKMLQELAAIDSAYERLFQKIHNDIVAINHNILNHIQIYDVPLAYYLEMKGKTASLFGKISPYSSGKANGGIDDKWTVKAPGTVALRDKDMGSRMITFPLMADPSIPQDKSLKLFSFQPLLNAEGKPVFLAEFMINGDLYAFKGYLKSETIDRTGKRGAVFDAEYALSHDLPFSFKIVYDEAVNELACLFKYDTTPDKFTSIIKLNVSVHLLVGKNLAIETMNTTFDAEIA